MTIKDIINYLDESHYNSKCTKGIYTEVVFEYEDKHYIFDKNYEFDDKNILHINLKEIK